MADFTLRNDIPNGTANGNACYLCGSPQREVEPGVLEPFVDTNLTIDYEGFLMFCSHCVDEMGRKLGMLSETVASLLVEDSENLKKEVERLKIQLSLTEDAMVSVTRYQDFVSAKEA